MQDARTSFLQFPGLQVSVVLSYATSWHRNRQHVCLSITCW